MAKHKFKAAAKVETTLYETFNQFIEEKQALNRSAATLKNYKVSYNIFTEYHKFDEDTLLENLELSHFYKFINHCKNNEVREQSINHYIRDWRTFLNWCYEREIIREPVKLKEIKVQEDLPKMYQDDEIAIMLEKPKEGESFSNWRTWAIISTVYATGLRAATLCDLTLEDLNFERGEIAIEKQKNKKAGLLPLTAALANVLKEYIKKWLKNAELTDWLFPSITGEQFNVNALNHSIERYCKLRGIDGHGIHSIRHNFARDLIAYGGTPFHLQKYLQHSDIKMSQHYVKLFASDLKQNAEDISPLDNAKKKAKRTSKFTKN